MILEELELMMVKGASMDIVINLLGYIKLNIIIYG